MDFRIFTEPQQGASYADLLAVAQRAEHLGYDGFFRSDHYLKMGDVSGLPGPTDAWLTLAALARDTSRVRLGTLVTSATFRLPGPLAISVAQVDDMSGGRVELGIGAGWFDAEHAAYGIPFPSVHERFDRLEEQLAVISGLWGNPAGERFSFDGEHYQVTDSPGLPKPIQTPPPIIIGGQGKTRTPALAARYAAEFNVAFQTLEVAQRQYRRVAQACEVIDRDPEDLIRSVGLVLCCGRDDAEFARRAAAIGRDPAQLRAAGAAGTVDETVAAIAKFADAGATRVYLQVLDLGDLDHLDLVAEEVVPQFS